MAKSNDRKHGAKAMSGAALAVAMIGSAGLAGPAAAPPPETKSAPPPAAARAANLEKIPSEARIHMKFKSEFKHKGEYAVAGLEGGRVVFEDDRGNLFYVDETTGDQKFVTRKAHQKVELNRVAKADHWIKLGSKVSILGVEQGGKLIITNTRGEKFYLDPVTGDMIFVEQ